MGFHSESPAKETPCGKAERKSPTVSTVDEDSEHDTDAEEECVHDTDDEEEGGSSHEADIGEKLHYLYVEYNLL